MLNIAPDASVDSTYVKNTKGGRRVYAGGCTRKPDAPVKGIIKCTLKRYL